jgi:hypothetical protein
MLCPPEGIQRIDSRTMIAGVPFSGIETGHLVFFRRNGIDAHGKRGDRCA